MTADDPFRLPFDEAGTRPPSARRQVLTVTELTLAIRELLEGRLADVWVEGELSNCRLWNTGHLYFTLKDASAQVRAVMFRSAVRALRFRPEDGVHVVARGRISVYEPKGEYQIVCERLEPHGLGARQLAFDQLKRRLQAEGLFDEGRKRALPLLPRKIGVVTSLDGAALRDVVRVLTRRYPNVHLVVRPARVQGDGAAAEVARGLDAIGRVDGVEVIIVGRGGGSVEDLWAFNEEVVARAIVRAPVPVISAVGHETDFTIADFAADLRAPTPSAAAELVVARKDEIVARIERAGERLRAAARRTTVGRRAEVHALSGRRGLAGWPARLAARARHHSELTHDLRKLAGEVVARRERRLTELRLRLEACDVRRRLDAVRLRLNGASARLDTAAARGRAQADSRLREVAGRLATLSPLAVLGRGYAVCWNAERTAVIRRAASLTPGDSVRVTLHEGELTCGVTRID